MYPLMNPERIAWIVTAWKNSSERTSGSMLPPPPNPAPPALPPPSLCATKSPITLMNCVWRMAITPKSVMYVITMIATCIRVRDLRSRSMSSWFSEACAAVVNTSVICEDASCASVNQDDIERERKSRTRMQVAIIVMTYITLLGVMAILQTQFIDVMGDLVAQSDGGGSAGGAGFGGGGSIDPEVLSLLFFHAVTIQAILSGFISGYIRDAELVSGVKYAVILMTLALGVWIYVG